MASPKGTTIAELSKCLSVTRRSIFRLIRTMEQDYKVPVIMKRETFGGSAKYNLPQSFIDNLSKIENLPISLSFDEAILMFILINSGTLSGKYKTQPH